MMLLPSALVLAILPLYVVASPLSKARHVEQIIPLAKRGHFLEDDGTVNVGLLQASLNRTYVKLRRGLIAHERHGGEAHPLSSTVNVSLGEVGSVPLEDDKEQLWYGAIYLGTPPKQYTVDFDTGSSDLFLPGPYCTDNCKGHATYDPNISTTSTNLHKSFRDNYGDGSAVSGDQYADTVSVGGLIAFNQTLGVARTYSKGLRAGHFKPNGLMGMAFKDVSDFPAEPFFQTLVAQGSVTDPIFAFKLAPSGSELYLGGTNPNLYTGEFTWVDVTRQWYWQINLDAVSVNGQPVLPDVRAAIVDTGTTAIIGDQASVARIYASIVGAVQFPSFPGVYTIPCDSTDSVSLTFAGKAFSISHESFSLGRIRDAAGSERCVGGLIGVSGFQFIIIGDVFLQNVYTAFDVSRKGRVGFADLA